MVQLNLDTTYTVPNSPATKLCASLYTTIAGHTLHPESRRSSHAKETPRHHGIYLVERKRTNHSFNPSECMIHPYSMAMFHPSIQSIHVNATQNPLPLLLERHS